MTDKLKKSTSSTDSTEKTLEALYISGKLDDVLRKIVRLALCDLLSANKDIRGDAHRYLLSKQFKEDCDQVKLPYNDILKTVSVSIDLKKAQQKAIIKKLLQQLGV